MYYYKLKVGSYNSYIYVSRLACGYLWDKPFITEVLMRKLIDVGVVASQARLKNDQRT